MEQNTEALVKRVKAGDKTALSSLVSKYEKQVYRICYRFFNNEEDALDASQEVFIKVIQNIDSFECKSMFKTWIYRITLNTCLSISDRKKRERDGILKYLTDWIGNLSFFDVESEVIEKEEKELNHQILQESIIKIPEKYRVPLILKDLEDLSLERISEICEIPIGTVKSRLNRARIMLMEKIEIQLKANEYEKM